MRLLLSGLGNVGRNLARILDTQRDLLRERHGLAFTIVGAADSTGAALNPAGLDPRELFAHKDARRPIGALAHDGRPGMSALEMVRTVDADCLMEATPVDLATGQPGLDVTRAAFARGMHVVLANKGPLALAFQELEAAAAQAGKQMRFSSGVGGSLPTINIGRRDLAGARILKIEAMVNGTCQGILRMMESGVEFGPALAEMQRRGIAEPNPDLDIDGWDMAVKLVIIANAVLRRPTTLADIQVRGIRELTLADLRAAELRGERVMLLGLAAPSDGAPSNGDWRLSVGPVSLPVEHPLARMSGEEMGVVYHTDIAGRLFASSSETDATPTAAAMLRDLIGIAVGAS